MTLCLLEGSRLSARCVARRIEGADDASACAQAPLRRRHAAGIVAAGVYALEHNIGRLVEDHANARRLAQGLSEAGLPVDPAEVETNFVLLDCPALGLSPCRSALPSCERRACCLRRRRDAAISGPSRTSTSRRTTSSRRSPAPCALRRRPPAWPDRMCQLTEAMPVRSWARVLVVVDEPGMPELAHGWMIGRSAAPFALSSYSTRGGDSG